MGDTGTSEQDTGDKKKKPEEKKPGYWEQVKQMPAEAVRVYDEAHRKIDDAKKGIQEGWEKRQQEADRRAAEEAERTRQESYEKNLSKRPLEKISDKELREEMRKAIFGSKPSGLPRSEALEALRGEAKRRREEWLIQDYRPGGAHDYAGGLPESDNSPVYDDDRYTMPPFRLQEEEEKKKKKKKSPPPRPKPGAPVGDEVDDSGGWGYRVHDNGILTVTRAPGSHPDSVGAAIYPDQPEHAAILKDEDFLRGLSVDQMNVTGISGGEVSRAGPHRYGQPGVVLSDPTPAKDGKDPLLDPQYSPARKNIHSRLDTILENSKRR